jgi:hypothetical protein
MLRVPVFSPSFIRARTLMQGMSGLLTPITDGGVKVPPARISRVSAIDVYGFSQGCQIFHKM